MNDSISREEAFKIIDAGHRKKRKRRRIRSILFLLSLTVAPQLLGLSLAFVTGEKAIYEVVAWMQLLLCLPIGVVWLLLKIRARLFDESRVWKDAPQLYGTKLFENGFYELALEEFDKEMKSLFENAQKHDEDLTCFFAEYNALARFVDGFPRPVPQFINHDLDEFDRLIACRIACLIKLGRTEEAEVATAQRALIEKIHNEEKRLTEKYWEIEEDFD